MEFSFIKKLSVKRPLTSAEQVDKARNRVTVALSSFNAVHGEVEVAIQELEQAIAQDDAAIMRLRANRNKAGEELNMNRALKDRLAEFIR